MATTQELQVAGLANQIMSLSAQLYGMGQQINALSAMWTNLSAATKLNAFPTAAATTSGALGTADGSSNVANPIDVRVTIGSDLNRAISANNLAGLLTYLQGVASVINGSAVGANGAAAQIVALCL